MNAKEKAKELFDKYNKGEYLFHQVDVNGAKEAAIIGVDEILHFMDVFNLDIEMKHQHKWWLDVKSELQSF
jgi:hypothetical protein